LENGEFMTVEKNGPRRMLKCLTILSLLLFSEGVYAASITELLAKGDTLYSVYDYSASAQFYRQAASADNQSFDAYWKLGRSLNFLGELVPNDSQLAVFEDARNAEQSALKLRDSSADAHFQLARAIGKIALFKGVFKSIGLAKQVKAEAERALALDSLHDGAWHILGRWNREVAKKPKLFRVPLGLGAANKQDAIAFMQKAVSLDPQLVDHNLEMGITYLEYDMNVEARAEFNRCLSLPGQGPIDDKYKEEAKKYLAGMDKK
jgi:tetratricopeptide (TPR) repeat protein